MTDIKPYGITSGDKHMPKPISPAEVAVFIGVDVGKDTHHAVALDRTGKRLYDRALPNDEGQLRAMIAALRHHGALLLVVDQPSTIGALPVTVARSEGITVGCLPGLAMRRIADLHPGEAKTDARDAAIIAEAARTLPHALRALRADSDDLTELSVLCGFDDDLTAQITQVQNRIRGLLTQIHPALERVTGPRLGHAAVLELLASHPSPAQLAACGEEQLAAELKALAPRMYRRLARDIMQALSEQSVVVPGTASAAAVLPCLCAQLQVLRGQRSQIGDKIEQLAASHPLYPVLTSMPGVGVRTAARLLTEVVSRDFPSAAHLAAYAGLAPVTRRSGISVRGEHVSRRGNRVLKRAMFLTAFAALRNPESRVYYDAKIAQGKRHNQALLALAHRRCSVLFAMIRDNRPYAPPQLAQAA